jgi:hypothetical protein
MKESPLSAKEKKEVHQHPSIVFQISRSGDIFVTCKLVSSVDTARKVSNHPYYQQA